jgi:hypothetical protein
MPGKENGVRPMIVGVAQERRISFHRNGVNISEAPMSSPHDKSRRVLRALIGEPLKRKVQYQC